MKKNTSLLLLFTFCFYSSTAPMELVKNANEASNDAEHSHCHKNDDDSYLFSELTPATSASIAIAVFLERADINIDEKIDLMLQKGWSLFCKGCLNLAKWFAHNEKD